MSSARSESRSRQVAVVTGVTALGVAITLALSGCSGAKSSAASTSSAAPSASSGASGGAQRVAPGASGLVAALSAGQLEVQNAQTGQTTVTYTASTAFSQQKAVTESAVVKGVCVSAIDATAFTGTPPSGSATSPRPSTPPGAPTAITASTITITAPVNGSCTVAGRGAFGGPGGSGARPSGVPTASRTAGTRTASGGGFGGLVSGKVTSVSGSSIAVQALDRQTNATVNDTVTVTTTTKYTETLPATASVLKVGLCASAFGKTDSTGSVAATRIDISSAQNGSCTTGFGGRGAFGGPRGGSTTTGG